MIFVIHFSRWVARGEKSFSLLRCWVFIDHIWRAWYNGSDTTAAEPIKTLELYHDPLFYNCYDPSQHVTIQLLSCNIYICPIFIYLFYLPTHMKRTFLLILVLLKSHGMLNKQRAIFIETERAERPLILIYHYVIRIKLLSILIFIL